MVSEYHYISVAVVFTDGAKLGMEGTDESGPVVHPVGNFVGVQDWQFEVLQGGSAKVG